MFEYLKSSVLRTLMFSILFFIVYTILIILQIVFDFILNSNTFEKTYINFNFKEFTNFLLVMSVLMGFIINPMAINKVCDKIFK